MLEKSNTDVSSCQLKNVLSFIFLLNIFAMIRGYAFSNFLEAILFIFVICHSGLRSDLFNTLKYKPVKFLMIYLLWICIAQSWGSGPFEARIQEVLSWRKMFLLPIGLVIFEKTKAVNRVSGVMLWTCIFFLALSYFIYFFFPAVGLWGRGYVEIMQNHSTQGVLFSFASLYCIQRAWKGSLTLASRLAWVGIGSAFAINVVFITDGRSGYLAFVIMALAYGISLFKTHRYKVLASFFLIVVAMISSDTVQYKLNEGIHGFFNVGNSSAMSSMGIRRVMWIETIDIIKQYPLLGVGGGDAYRETYSDQVIDYQDWKGVVTDNPHQQFLLITAQYGLIGLMIFLYWLILIFKEILRIKSIFPLAVFAALVTLSFFNGIIGDFIIGRWIFIGVFVLLFLNDNQNKRLDNKNGIS